MKRLSVVLCAVSLIAIGGEPTPQPTPQPSSAPKEAPNPGALLRGTGTGGLGTLGSAALNSSALGTSSVSTRASTKPRKPTSK
jgi:hypothetical protein